MTKMQYETEERQKREEVKDGSPNSFFLSKELGNYRCLFMLFSINSGLWVPYSSNCSLTLPCWLQYLAFLLTALFLTVTMQLT